ncbi:MULTISPECIES: CBS domain-containing protein [unclassified Halanaerobium]|uniref:CBS domain-containing protein n=1 Tax=unclassified Halanaerobium TaxID=2641197 RepID=UPI000DF3C4A0|nr:MULTISPECIES: CBS domain-containing protein [unclassified Halanaerobium]RCW45392.1 CBS domain protein [Halanaerobium sp. MA284_MarDTE_T2]RCW82570.1 CBS domain protein [Halanaerobium sp. DL-01]
MQLTDRQNNIIAIVKNNEPISSQNIAKELGLSRTAIRSDLSLLTMLELLDAKPKVGYYLKKGKKLTNIDDLLEKPVSEFMSSPVSVEENQSIYDTTIKLFMEDVGTVFVTDTEEELTGIISRKDLLKMSIGHGNLKKTPVSLAMTRMPNIISVKKNEKFIDVLEKIVDNEIDSLPVIDNKKIVGRVSKTILLQTIMNIAKKF